MTANIRSFVLRALRFGLVGGLATALYVLLAAGLVIAGWSAVMAHVVASVISLAASYIGQKIYTFEARDQNRKYGARFLIATALIAGSQFLIVLGLSEYTDSSDFLILFVATVYYPATSFLIHSFWTFKQT